MEKILQQLQTVNELLADCDKEAAVVRTLPYYRIFRQEAQRKADLYAIQLRSDSLHLEKQELLDELADAVNAALPTL